jgi:hypothetical protein
MEIRTPLRDLIRQLDTYVFEYVSGWSRAVSLYGERVFIFLAPIVAVPLFGICLINHDGYVDPWIYMGYAQMLKPLVGIYGWTYYCIRFPVIGLMSFFAAVFKEPFDFVLLRYIIYLITAFALYRFFCKTFSKGAGLAAIVTLLAAPQFGRILLWDVASFLAIPAALIGMCLWLIPTRRMLPTRMAAGFMFCVAVNSHVFVTTAIAAFLAVQLVLDWCAFRLKQFVTDFGWALLGGLICLVIGIIYYNLAVGPFGLRTLIDATLGSLKLGLDYHREVQTATTEIFMRDFPIYVPLLLTAMNGILLGRQIFSTAIGARIFWFSAAYILFFALFQFVGGHNILGFFWYAAFLFPTVILQIPIVIDELMQSSRQTIGWNSVTTFTACVLIVALLNNWVGNVDYAFDAAGNSSLTIVVVLAFAAATAALAIASFSAHLLRPAAAIMLGLFMQTALFSSGPYHVVFESRYSRRQFAVYSAASDLITLASNYNESGHRLRIWYPRYDTSMYGLSFVIVGSTIQPPHGVYDTGMPTIGETERAALAAPDTAYVLLAAQTDDLIEAGMAALRSAGVQFEIQAKIVLGSDATFQEKGVLISLRR